MSSREIAELTDKRHDHVKRDIENMLSELDRDVPSFGGIYFDSMNRQQTEYHLDKELTETLITGYSIKLRNRVIKRLHELESRQPVTLPSYAETLRLYADQIEETQRVTVERDIAVATKAEIGSRREATAMSTASAASRKAAKLQRELDQSKEYITIKRMSMLTHGQQFDWRLLKSASQDVGVDPIDVFDANYGTVKAYHAGAWFEAYGLEVQL